MITIKTAQGDELVLPYHPDDGLESHERGRVIYEMTRRDDNGQEFRDLFRASVAFGRLVKDFVVDCSAWLEGYRKARPL